MTNQKEQLVKYSKLAVQMGVNLQKDQGLIINAPVEAVDFVRMIAEEAYALGAKNVHIEWNDEGLTYLKMKHAPLDVLKNFPKWKADGLVEMVKDGYALLSIYGPNPDLLKDIAAERVAASNKASGQALSDYRNYVMNDKVCWSVIGYPETSWAQKVFPDLDKDDAKQKLWEKIYSTTRVDQEDPVSAWARHNETLRVAREYLNEKQYKKLVYKGPGTDLTIELPDHHIWHGGSAVSESGVEFNPNLPTEEVFTMPHKYGVNGTVVSTKPLNYGGNLIENFTLTFKEGKVVDFKAEKGEETLKHLLDTDEGARRLGEVALVPHESPISQSNIIFYNTLFDENASCHLALGKAYPTNIKNGPTMSEEEMNQHGVNDSFVHEDFMVGSADLDIDGITKDGRTEPIFRQGNWAMSFQ
ncbi:aminopeptidase [Aquibacillus sp. 3ASR75-11]|uniref:Aminopeptidase n=1 Tax=Terrihalobacillus insolitus TaxID=2950438 RepID=A0A9X3WX03_9BACI|nr:aminopeptidase [Terrihalobacillus insolitus]MDC3414588.1 aminopeptidase [Terrihalobacillus insolitus]MDC3425736.1 aminopeptidase [Terrihalobacillus insolitus]